MRQIEDRIKKELKNLQKAGQINEISIKFNNQGNESPEASSNMASTPRDGLSSRKESNVRVPKMRDSYDIDEEDKMVSIKNSFDKIAMAKLNERL